MVGRYLSVLEDTGRNATVTLFTSELGEPMPVTVANGAAAYDCEYTDKTFTLLISNALYFQNMYMNLAPPIIMRIAGLDVDE